MFATPYTSKGFWGGKKEHIENAQIAIVMFIFTVLYEAFSHAFFAGFSFNIYEFIGTWSGLTTVWLSRTENVLCWPWGILSAIMFGFFFGSIGLPGQQWLNWGYFLVIQLWAWPHWAFGGEKRTPLAVSSMSYGKRIVAVLGIVALAFVVYTLIDLLVPGSRYPILDAVVVASSVVAQYLLGRKKIESWFLWLGPVNLLSIALFYVAGAYTVMALYIAFFIHALFALKSWSANVRTVLTK